MAVQQVSVTLVDHPADMGMGETSPQGGQDGQAVNDVAEGARLEEHDAAGVEIGERRTAPGGHA